MRTLLALLSLSFCLTATAGWVRVGDDRLTTIEKYIDPDKVKQTGPMAIMRQLWEINNFTEPDKDGALSVKILAEYDCQNRQYRTLEQLRFTEVWAQGRELKPVDANQSASAWSAVPPGGIHATVIDMICPGGNDSCPPWPVYTDGGNGVHTVSASTNQHRRSPLSEQPGTIIHLRLRRPADESLTSGARVPESI